MAMPHRSTSPTSTESSSFSHVRDVTKDNHSLPQPSFETLRGECESCESQPRTISLPPFSVLWNTLTEPWPTSMPSLSRPFKYEHYQPRLPSPCPDCTGRPLPSLTRPHSAPARYEPYSPRHPSTSKKPLNPRTFVDPTDIDQCFHHRGEYLSHTSHGAGCTHSYPGRSTDFGDFATPRPCATEPAVGHYVRNHVCPCGGCPVRERHYSDTAGRYLNVPELPSRRNTGRPHTRYPASRDDRPHIQGYNLHDMRPQARSTYNFVEGSSSDTIRAVSAFTSDWSEGEDDEPLSDDGCNSPLTLNSQPSKPPIVDEWKKYCMDLGKKNGSRAKLFRCTYTIVRDNGLAKPCDKEGAKSTIKRHIDAVHFDIRGFSCKICPKGRKAFGQLQGLRVHINAVHREIGPYIPFICKHCQQEFADPSQRHKHYKNQHPEAEIKKRRKLPYAQVSC